MRSTTADPLLDTTKLDHALGKSTDLFQMLAVGSEECVDRAEQLGFVEYLLAETLACAFHGAGRPQRGRQ